MGENGNRDVVIVVRGEGGYKKKHPPVDDVCPICFDSFKIPCRTNCGHWYCGGCFLQFWRHTPPHTEDVKWCKCPMCECVVKKLIPYSSKLILPEEDAQKILKDIRGYNYQHVRRWFAFFLEVITVVLLPLRRLPPEGAENRRMLIFLSIYSRFSIVLVLASLLSLSFMPSWYGDVIVFTMLFSNLIWMPVIIYFQCDKIRIWYRRRRLVRQLAQALAQHIER